MKLVSKELTLAAILALPVEQQDEMAVAFVRGNNRLKDTKDEQKEGAKVIGKLLCALEIRLEAGKKANAIAANETLAEYFKKQYGGPVQTHPLSLKNAFGAYVGTSLITETDYDVNSGNCLELAARIVTAVNGDLTHDAVKRAAAQLIERSNKEAKNLRDILASVKPAAKLTPDEALEMFERIAADGQLPVVLAHLPDTALKLPEGQQREIYVALGTGFNRYDTALGMAKTAAWTAEMDAATAPVQLVQAAA